MTDGRSVRAASRSDADPAETPGEFRHEVHARGDLGELIDLRLVEDSAIHEAADRSVRSGEEFQNLTAAQQKTLVVTLQCRDHRCERAGLVADTSDNHSLHT